MNLAGIDPRAFLANAPFPCNAQGAHSEWNSPQESQYSKSHEQYIMEHVNIIAAGAVDREFLIYVYIYIYMFVYFLLILAPYERLWARASSGDTNLTRRIDLRRLQASGIPKIKISATFDFAISAATGRCSEIVSKVGILDGAVMKK